MYFRVLPSRQPFSRSEFRQLREIEVVYLHRRHNHVERFFPACADGSPQSCNILQHIHEALIEAEVAHSARQLSILDQEGAVPGHASKDLLVRIDLTDIPQTRHQNATFGGRNHLFNSLRALIASFDNYVHRRVADLVGQWKTMSGSADLPNLGRQL